MSPIPVRLGLQQRVLPEYRAPFFDMLAGACPKGLGVFAGEARAEEAIKTVRLLNKAVFFPARNIHIPVRKSYALLQAGFLDWLKIWQPEALIVEANSRYLSTPFAVRWMHDHHYPVIGWGLGVKTSSRLGNALRENFLSSLDAVIAYSQKGAEEYLAAGIPEKKVFIAPNAVAPRPLHGPVTRPDVYENGKPTILYVGRLQARKRLDVLLESCCYLPQALKPHVIIVGDGPEMDSLKQMSAKFYPDTEFAGAKHGEELEPYFLRADLFVLPGTGGLAVQQAMAHSLPVLVGEADGTQSELVRPENGWILKETFVPALSEALENALQSPVQLRKMGVASHRIVSDEVNLEKMVEAFTDAVNSVLAG